MRAELNVKNKFFFRLSDLFFLLLFLIFPIFCLDYTKTTEHKFFFLLASVLCFVSVFALVWVEFLIVGKRTNPFVDIKAKTVFTSPLIYFIIYCLLCLVSFLLSDYSTSALIGDGGFDGLITQFLYLFIVLSVVLFGDFKKKYAYALAFAVLFNLVIGLLQFYGFNPLHLFPEGYDYHDAFILYANRFLGSFGNVDNLSAFLSITVPTFAFLSAKSIGKRFVFLIITAFSSAFLLILCETTAGVLASILALLIIPFFMKTAKETARLLKAYFFISLAFIIAFTILGSPSVISVALFFSGLILLLSAHLINKFSPEQRKIRLFLLIFELAILFISVVLFFSIDLMGDLAEIKSFLSGNMTDEQGSGRIRIWRAAVDIIKDNPIFGTGPDTFIYEIPFKFERLSDVTGEIITSSIPSAHNVPLNIAANTGLPSLLFYLLFVLSLIFRLIRSRGEYSGLFVAVIISYFLQSLFSFHTCGVTTIFMLICGFAVKYTITKNKEVKL